MERDKGFTLIELLVTVVVLGVLLSMAVPSMKGFFEKRRLIGAAEAVFSQLQLARSEAIARSADVYASFSTDGSTTWSVGVSTVTDCVPTETDRTDATACTLIVDDGDALTDDRVLNVLSSTAYPGVSMGNDSGGAVSFSGGVTQLTFNYVRGTATNGTVYLYSGTDYEMRVISSTIGRVRICSPTGTMNVAGYASC
ncbi:MAG: GspH/FimT family pseudopilin [Gammaproteobacteria bacterium]|nr:GspH/FimT family pseudopilin [Gammaproteobacteria bacterium]